VLKDVSPVHRSASLSSAACFLPLAIYFFIYFRCNSLKFLAAVDRPV
jgi:hypothetical protein